MVLKILQTKLQTDYKRQQILQNPKYKNEMYNMSASIIVLTVPH